MLFGRRINKGYTAMVYSVLQESNASTDGSVEWWGDVNAA